MTDFASLANLCRLLLTNIIAARDSDIATHVNTYILALLAFHRSCDYPLMVGMQTIKDASRTLTSFTNGLERLGRKAFWLTNAQPPLLRVIHRRQEA